PPGCLARGADQAGAGAPLCAAHGLLAIPPSQAALRRSIRVQQTSWRNAFAREVLERSARSLSSPREGAAPPRAAAARASGTAAAVNQRACATDHTREGDGTDEPAPG